MDFTRICSHSLFQFLLDPTPWLSQLLCLSKLGMGRFIRSGQATWGHTLKNLTLHPTTAVIRGWGMCTPPASKVYSQYF